MEFLTHEAVTDYRRLKELDEIRLAQGLNDVFMKTDLCLKGQDQVRLLVDTMLGSGSTAALDAALKEESGLRVWRRSKSGCSRAGLIDIWETLGLYDCDLHDCADLLRLFGVFAEHHPAHQAGVSAKRAAKPEDDSLHGAFKKLQTLDPRKHPKRFANKEFSAGSQSGGFRARSESRAVLPEDQDREGIPSHLMHAFSADSRPTLKSGCNRWALRMQSKSCQIDKVFGLPFGGDISGTTADSMYGLDLATKLNDWANPQERKAFDFLTLMPLISLVGLYNHTVLECALAMMYCDIIDDYHVGYYTTLFPKECDKERFKAIWETLRNFEMGCPKMVVYTRQDLLRAGKTNVLRGFRMANQAERDRFKPLASVKNFYRDALLYPDNSAKAVIKLMGPTLGKEMVTAVHWHDKTHHTGSGRMMSEAEYLSYSFFSKAQDPFRNLWKRIHA